MQAQRMLAQGNASLRSSIVAMQVPMRADRILKSNKRPAVATRASPEYEALKGATVYSAGSGDPVNITDLWQADQGSKVVIPFLTHFADLTSWEYARKLAAVMPTLESSGVQIITVGLGSHTNAQEFSKYMRFPMDKLYADPTGAAYKALAFNPGFAPDVQISPYAKLIPMLAGIGSPGTVQEVIRGYLGDREAKSVFDSPTPFDVLGLGYQRPFELATLRLFNMFNVLSKWGDLSPSDQSLLIQQGGTIAFEGDQVIFRHNDSGILKYADVDEVLRTVLAAQEASGPPLDVVAESTQ